MISREEFWRLVRFGFVGGGATLVDLGTSIALFHTWPTISEHGLLFAGLSGLLPVVIATLTVTVLTYVLSRVWVFA